MTPSFFITGTDTGIGKTYVSAGLAAAFVRRKIDVGVMKPFASGARKSGAGLVSDDARILKRAARVDDPLDLINPVCLRAPLAPSMAAALAGTTLRLAPVLAAWRRLRAAHDLLLVEGVGGLLVPLFRGLTVADFARRLRLPLVIVTRPSLGTLNHSALTVQAARAHGLRVRGFVINHATKARRGLAEALNPAALEAQNGVPVLAEIPFGAPPSAFDRLARRLLS